MATACIIACAALLLTSSTASAQSAPNLGTVGTYGAFSGAGAIENTGLTVVTGDIGTYVGSFTGFPPGLYTGAKHVADAEALSAKNDLILAYNSLNDATNAVLYDTALGATMGNGQVLSPRTYGRGDLTTIAGNLTFDAKGDPAAVFIVKIGGALDVAANTQIILANGARAENIYWAVDGAVSILDNSVFKGTILANGAIHLYGGSTLEGRALAVVGAVTMASNLVSVPGAAMPADSLIVITPAPGSVVAGGTERFMITWGGTGIAPSKTLEYSLDSGRSWSPIATINTDGFSHEWTVPDTSSTKAYVRVTDADGLSGTSGMFTIADRNSADALVVVRPATGEMIEAGTRNYQIHWNGVGIGMRKTFEYSLDNGATWQTIGTLNGGDDAAYSWDVPDVTSDRALIRITDENGLSGTSGMFTITESTPDGNIIVVRPASGEMIIGGTQNYQILWSGTQIASSKTLEYSLDSGRTWLPIGTVVDDGLSYSWSVPDVATRTAYVRVTDANGVRGTSGLFTILSSTAPVASIIVVRPSAGERIDGGTENYQILFTAENTTTQKLVELSTDAGMTWSPLGAIATDASSFTWTSVPNISTNRALVRITDLNGVVGTSGMFTISSIASVASDRAAAGYSISSRPNPVTSQVTIDFALPVAADVMITISDGMGRLVATAAAEHYASGRHSVVVDTDELADGTYWYVLHAGATRVHGRMSIVR